jgi:tRNA-modifying protein YgfZ
MNTFSTIRITGADAFEFLQGQLTNDLRKLETRDAISSAWCNPKGRVICLMEVSRIEGGYACEVPSELLDSLIKRLTMFRFRSKVEFSTHSDTAHRDAIRDVERAVPFIGLQQTEKYTPHMLNLDRLDAVSFDKGCYTGQEIVARTHYKGATKRRTFLYRSEVPVAVGDKVSDASRAVGEVLNVAGTALLAIVPVDSALSPLTANNVVLEALQMPYP